MDMQGCTQSLQISVMTHTPVTTVYDLPGEITWSADQTILTFHPLSSPVEGSNITLSMEITNCRSLAAPNYRLRESALRYYVMDELHCMRLISMAPEQDGCVISGYPEVYSDTEYLYAGTMANGDEIRTLIHMNLDVLHYYAGFDIPSEEIEFASVQLLNADPWGSPPSDIILEFLPFSSQLSIDHFDMPPFSGSFSSDPLGIFTLYPPYEQTGFVVTEAIRTAVDNSEMGVILRIRARDLVIDGVQNRVAYWAMGGPPYNEYWPNLYICYWKSWNESYF